MRLVLIASLFSWVLADAWSNGLDRNSPDKIRGVNIGGWLITEPWMSPSLFSQAKPYATNLSAVWDEWTLCLVLGRERAQTVLEKHWQTYITEDDFSQIKSYGLNTVRIPIGYWAWEKSVVNGEPYVSGQLPYLQQALDWANKHSLGVILDLHGVPGSQNGYDNSGLRGTIGFAANSSNTGIALEVLYHMTQLAMKPTYNSVVKTVEILNEPFPHTSAMDFAFVQDFYIKALGTMRQAAAEMSTTAKMPIITIHDAFSSSDIWREWFYQQNIFDQAILDTHTYFVPAWKPDLEGYKGNDLINEICKTAPLPQNPVTIVMEWSLGTFVECVDWATCIDRPLASVLNNTDEDRIWRRQMYEASASTFEQGAGWVFWSWKSETTAYWSYQLGVQQGYIPINASERMYTYDRTATPCLNVAQTALPSKPNAKVSPSAHINKSNTADDKPAEWVAPPASNSERLRPMQLLSFALCSFLVVFSAYWN